MRKKKGVVTSAKMTGTVTVTVHRHALHPKYKKRFRISTKFLVDTAEHKPNVGDLVIIGECRPISKRKCFKVLEILKRAAEVSELVEEVQLQKTMFREKHAPEKATKENNDSSLPAKQVGASS